MFKCHFCGLENASEKARFCSLCGPDGPAKDWASEDIDQPAKVTQYASLLGEFYFGAQDNASVEKFSLRIRERLKVSFDTHSSVLSKLAKQKKAIAHLANFRFEFNENVMDAYAGHDTFLNFRYTNLSEDDLFKVSLLWDDPNTSDRIDLKAETKSFIQPKASATIGASTIFDRIGIKEVSDLQITVSDQFGESANFRVEPFGFKVGNHDQKIVQNISTHTQISIEGRGVVDASGIGAENPTSAQSDTSSQPRWRELSFSFIPEVLAQSSPSQKTVTTKKTTVVKFDKDNLLSVLSAAEQGDPEAQKILGNMYFDGNGVAQNDGQAVHWYRKAAEQGYALGENNLGVSYHSGRGVAQNDEQAVYWYRKAAEQGNPFGQKNLGNMYENGEGVAQNYEQAVYWYQKAAEQGNAAADYNLGLMYLEGKGVAQNDEQAVHWFRKAAEKGYAAAEYNLGLMYLEGKGVAQNDEQAVLWYRKAAEKGYAAAEYYLGLMYLEGKGVAQNDEQAVLWFRKAAEKGYAAAEYNLGFMYLEGKGVAQNDEQAVLWYRKAAEQGDTAGEYMLGFMYENGKGVAKNDEQALQWYRKSAKQGETFAIEAIKSLESS